ncbi:sigma-70 family RNA polymerase sigma factor [Nocardia abscessus]|uniref:sigma-70 family RNA polymerase sigma factor n=1 Tax=Nocardia abscessus TaxID=120957 RepID=UPI002458B76E|nr:sigma-70 family RNA polymerase sigma factor [Nocardia abscessus]
MSDREELVSDDDEFVRRADPFRRELLAHCYRLLGTVDEAEDLVQETYLRAWRSYSGFEGRSSLRTWLYRIATNACLSALENRGRRPLPSGLTDPVRTTNSEVTLRRVDGMWLEPIPDALVAQGTSDAADPAAVVVSRASVRLAFVAALQHLPARQRAVLILRDVLGWRAREVAELLGVTESAVKSVLRRARTQLTQVSTADEELLEPQDPVARTLLEQYVQAFERADVETLTRLLAEDAVLEMPPFSTWFAGRRAVADFARSRIFRAPGELWMTPTSANGQPAAAAYKRDLDGDYYAHGVHVLSVTERGIARIVVFLTAEVFPSFGLPARVSAAATSAAARS